MNAALACGLVGALLLGCGGGDATPRQPLVQTDVAPLAAGHLRSLAEAWRAGAGWIDDAPFTQAMGAMFGELAGGDAGAEGGDDEAVDEALETLADALEDEIMRPEHVRSDDGATIVYAIPEGMACGAAAGDEPDCVPTIGDAPPLLRVYSLVEGALVMEVLVGSPPTTLATLNVAPGRLDVSVSLATLARLELGEDVRVDEARGRLNVAISAAGPQAARLTASVDPPISLRASARGQTLRAEVGRATFDGLFLGADRTAALELDLGDLTVSAPLSMFGDDAPDVGLEVDVPGAGAGLFIDEDAATMSAEDVHLTGGPARVTLGGQTILTADLNPGDGRRLDLTVERAAEANTVTVAPALEVALTLALSRVEGMAPDFDAGWAADEAMRVRLDGAPSPALRVFDAGDATEIVAGRLAMTSAARPDLNLTAEAGACLFEEGSDGADDDEAHPFEAFSVGPCE